MSVVGTGQMSSAEKGQMSVVETGQMSAAETGQMSAVETGQMSAAETGQMSVNVEKPLVFIPFFYCPARGGGRSTNPGEDLHNKNPSLALSGKMPISLARDPKQYFQMGERERSGPQK